MRIRQRVQQIHGLPPRLTNDSVSIWKGSGPPSTLKVPLHTFSFGSEDLNRDKLHQQICSRCLWAAPLTHLIVSCSSNPEQEIVIRCTIIHSSDAGLLISDILHDEFGQMTP